LIPDDVQVDCTLQAQVLKLKEVNSKADDFDFKLPNKLLAARLRQENIECLDLLDEFIRAGNSTALYKPNDSHWNIAGNRLAADVIARDLFHVASRPATQN
jgi:SGNH hydrolase-like domain, acetyltransferase AlgX